VLNLSVELERCVECGGRVAPGDYECGRCADPRMRAQRPRVRGEYKPAQNRRQRAQDEQEHE
jgi:hypothetical protein